MALLPSVSTVDINRIPDQLFGGNVLAPRDRLDEDATFPEIVDQLGVDEVRYPGGALSEALFDIGDPDRRSVTDPESGDEVEILPISDFMQWSEDNDKAVTLVIPTRTYLSEDTDDNGERFAQIDEPELRGFLRDVLDGTYGAPELQALEIGNEYWGSGEMSSLEYGRVASRMAEIIDEEISTHPDAEQFAETDILVQVGKNNNFADLSEQYEDYDDPREALAAIEEDYGLNLPEARFTYESGEVAWPRIANELILSEFDTESEREAIDAVVSHVYSRAPAEPGSRTYEMDLVDSTWEREFPDIERYATEWNVSADTALYDRGEDYGLQQAHEMLNIVEVMGVSDVTAAHAWPLQQNTANTLGGEVGETELTPGGAMFSLMQEALPGTRVVDLDPGSRETEARDEGIDAHLFAGSDRLVMYLASTSDDPEDTVVDMSNLVSDPGTLTATRLGVREGDDPGSTEARPVLTDEPAEDLLDGTELDVSLGPREILEVRMDGPSLTPEFEAALAEAEAEDPDPPAQDDPPDDTPEDPEDDGEDEEDRDEASGDDGGFGGAIAALLLLPLLFLGG
ncbi:MAG: type I secretion protein [Paracoccaceae bacterium]